MADALHGFDMVLALTQNAVNFQFEALYKLGLADPKQAIMPAEVDWKIPNGRGTIKASLGATSASFMPNNTNYQQATFILPLTSGTFKTYTIDMTQDPPKVVPHTKPISNWQVAFVVDLKQMAFGSAAQATAKADGALTDAAHTELQKFPDDYYNVSALLYDFASANIAAFDKAHTKLPGLTADDQLSLANALTVYFQQERKAKYIVAIHASSKNPGTTAPKVAPTLVPTGVSYTTYGNPSTDYKPAGPPEGLSTLNYLTSTDGHGPPPAKPNGIFTTPFVTDNLSSGQLLISRAALVENFLLKKLGAKLGAAFSTSDPLTSVSMNPNGAHVEYSKKGGALEPDVSTSGQTTTTTTAKLSTTKPEIDITGAIWTYADFKIQFIWSGTWKVWREIFFTGKISIAASADSHSLALTYTPFVFGEEFTPRPDEQDTGATIDEVITLGQIDGLISGVLNRITGGMESWQEHVLTAGEGAMPGVFVPPTGKSYSLAPRCFNSSGDLVIDVNVETGS